jgi:TrpR-related protein YerC/YecD
VINEATWMTADDTWRTDDTHELFQAVLGLESVPEAEAFFRDLCTLGELRDMAQRWAVVRMLDRGLHYAEISGRTGASTATITRIAMWLRHGEGGYRLMLDRLGRDGGPAGPAARRRPGSGEQAPRANAR